jgi:DNA polymerase-3 subunit gamma/tau
MNEQNHLNLTRLYRVVRFNDVIGQDLVVRMLQNSLYTNQIFPVYLMSGKHGCGKTSVARIFASAANCSQIEAFRANPKQVEFPCQKCESCCAMNQGSHPDFIEIDAASHTGVDMIRGLIETASFLPVMGRYKVYLIDEAHMLSKAAFNALLKILEEPPKTVFFILATTDVQKIPETVRSRCFQLFFRAVDFSILGKYLKKICDNVNLSYTPEAINAIVHYSGGSVRDALNVIERVRYATDCIDHNAVKSVVGFIDDPLLLEMIEACWSGDMSYFKERFFYIFSSQMAVGLVWGRFIVVLHEIVKVKTGIISDQVSQQLQLCAEKVSLGFVYTFLNMLFEYEPLLLKTSAPIVLFHTVVMKNIRHLYDNSIKKNHTNSDESAYNEDVSSVGIDQGELLSSDDELQEFRSLWMVFVRKIEGLGDPLMHSLFTKITADFDKKANHLNLLFALQEDFLKDLLVEHQKKWLPLLHEVFGSEISFVLSCSLSKPGKPEQHNHLKNNLLRTVEVKKINSEKKNFEQVGDDHTVPSVKAVLKYFPGRVLFIES